MKITGYIQIENDIKQQREWICDNCDCAQASQPPWLSGSVENINTWGPNLLKKKNRNLIAKPIFVCRITAVEMFLQFRYLKKDMFRLSVTPAELGWRCTQIRGMNGFW